MTNLTNYSKNIQLIIPSPNSGDLRHYGAVSIILSGTNDDWEVYGHEVADTMAYFMDVCLDKMINEDKLVLLEWMITKLKIADRCLTPPHMESLKTKLKGI